MRKWGQEWKEIAEVRRGLNGKEQSEKRKEVGEM